MKKLPLAGLLLLAVVGPVLAGDPGSALVPKDDRGLVINASSVPSEVVAVVEQKESKPESNIISRGFGFVKNAVTAPVKALKEVPSGFLDLLLGKKEKKANPPAPVEAAKVEPFPGGSLLEVELDTWVEQSLASFEPNVVKAKEPEWDKLEYVGSREAVRDEELVPTKGKGLGNDILKAQILLQAMIKSEGKE